MKYQKKSLWIILPVVSFILLASAQPTLAEGKSPANATAKSRASGEVNIDFNDADIKLFIKFMAELTGRNFIIDEKVKGKVTVISPRKVSVDEAVKVFESTMEVYGYTLIEAGEVTKIIPANEARQSGAFGPGAKHAGDRVITRLIPLQYAKANEMVNTLRPLIPVTSFITAYRGTNTLILVDYASNVDKIMSIVKRLEVPGQEENITVTQLKYAGAKEMTQRLTKIFKGSGRSFAGGRVPPPPRGAPPRPGMARSGNEPKIIADERINALIIVAGKADTQRALSLIEQLDIPAPPGQGNINVYYLQNADADNLAKVLNNITSKAGKKRNVRPGQRMGVQLQSSVTVTPDKASNSLVITASKEDYHTLRAVIEKLDRRRLQVFVEALIMEVTTDRKRQLGIEWRTTSNFTNQGVQGIGGTNFGNINNVAQNPLEAAQGLTIGVVDGVINFAGKDFLNLGALIHALQSDTDINILSTPNIMTTDNEEAKIVVAQNVPFVIGESQNTGGNTITTIERKDIGITLKIKPQISESDVVKMDVYQEISSISPIQLDKARDLITSTRSIKTTVVVNDGQNIVLGGLIRDDVNDVESKVPFLGDIPLLGWLFKSTTKQKQKTNLLVFLTPHIIRNAQDVSRITDQRHKMLNMTPPAPAVDEKPDSTPAQPEKNDSKPGSLSSHVGEGEDD